MQLLWLALASVAIHAYQPLAEETWVALDPKVYPLTQPPPEIFAARRGNQYPALAVEQRYGRWQLLFHTRLYPPFALYQGKATLSKQWLARLQRIDAMAYGIVGKPETPSLSATQVVTPITAKDERPYVPAFAPEWSNSERSPWLGKSTRSQQKIDQRLIRLEQLAELPITNPSNGSLSAAAPVSARQCGHQVVAGETLWRIANHLAKEQQQSPMVMLLALVEANRSLFKQDLRVKRGDTLRCPTAEELAHYQNLSTAELQAKLKQAEAGNF